MSDPPGTVGLLEAARQLGVTFEEVFALVCSRRLKSVEASTGRRLVPVSVLDAWKAAHPSRPEP